MLRGWIQLAPTTRNHQIRCRPLSNPIKDGTIISTRIPGSQHLAMRLRSWLWHRLYKSVELMRNDLSRTFGCSSALISGYRFVQLFPKDVDLFLQDVCKFGFFLVFVARQNDEGGHTGRGEYA